MGDLSSDLDKAGNTGFLQVTLVRVRVRVTMTMSVSVAARRVPFAIVPMTFIMTGW